MFIENELSSNTDFQFELLPEKTDLIYVNSTVLQLTGIIDMQFAKQTFSLPFLGL